MWTVLTVVFWLNGAQIKREQFMDENQKCTQAIAERIVHDFMFHHPRATWNHRWSCDTFNTEMKPI